jgi:hypothetical protein
MTAPCEPWCTRPDDHECCTGPHVYAKPDRALTGDRSRAWPARVSGAVHVGVTASDGYLFVRGYEAEEAAELFAALGHSGLAEAIREVARRIAHEPQREAAS